MADASYRSPSGSEHTFDYESVSRDVSKRGTVFDFPGVNGAYVQEKGFGGRRYPMRCFFWGADHDRRATAFEAALLEPGIGRLQHPKYGAIDVVPFGDIGRRDDMVTETNQSVVEVTFFTTLGAVYPSGQGEPRNEVLDALAAFDTSAAEQYATQVDLSSTITRANARNDILGAVGDVMNAMASVASTTADVDRQWRALNRRITLGLDDGIGSPIVTAQSVIDLTRLPSQSLAAIEDRLDGYARLAGLTADGNRNMRAASSSAIPSFRTKQRNSTHAADLTALASVSGAVASATETTFRTRTQALATAENVLGQLDDVVAWREEAFAELDIVDMGGAYQQLQRAVALAAGYLVQIGFTLQPERRIVLDRPRTIIDLAAELYGEVDPRLDFLIDTNNLSGSEVLELPAGRTIVYY